MMKKRLVFHVAGTPNVEEGTQKCRLCGQILTDYRNAHGVGDWTPVWWSVGQPVTQEGMSTMTGRDPDAVPCVEAR